MKRILFLLLASMFATSGNLLAAPIADSLPTFDVVSVKPDHTEERGRSNVPLGPGDAYNPTGGHFKASGWPLINYILFAYRIVGDQAASLPSQMPGWVSTEHFDIEAQTDGNPSKDTKNQMRLMVRSLLADRFKMVVHTETKQVSVFGLKLATPGKTGAQLQAHPDTESCSSTFSRDDSEPSKPPEDNRFPDVCGAFLGMPPGIPVDTRVGARNITMAFIANGLSEFGNLGRPVVDQTGLAGNFDMSLEWFPETDGNGNERVSSPDIAGSTFPDAVKKQLGLRLDSEKGSIEILVVDHVERPSGN